ncbi:hypothetical protein GRX01_08650 [Halobaculum sp. WSA2]|uniref:DUF7305 domain-containing protein n=1 Tax=Halobaculum saliterrae TaxID=2073113 RepID=A0A6B0SRX3_9EURY|nr:hypothetical protein [Halobaculum saliterrae]MXR41405.1 hypothetical protein [Halobaculum saliterrae]
MRAWGTGDSRAQGDVIALVLLLAITVVGASAIVAFGGDAITGIQQSATDGAAEQSMTQFDSKASLVAHGDSDAQSVRLTGSGGATRAVEADAGWMNVTIRNTTDDEVTAVLTNTTLGAVTYREGDTVVAYQGGGVWRRTDGGSTMVSPPEFHYRGTTLTLPLVTVSGDARLDDDARITRSNDSTAVYPDPNRSNRTNPLDEGKVVIVVHSEFYRAWGQFFAERTQGSVSVDDANETATIVLQTPTDLDPVRAALTSRAVGDEISLDGTGNSNVWIDSYNSSNGSYAATKSANGTVTTAGSIDIQGNGKILGSVRSGASVNVGTANGNITGTVEHTTGYNANPNAEPQPDSDRVSQIDGVAAGDDLSPFVRSRIEAIEADNDNANTSAITESGGEYSIDFGGDDTATLSGDDGTEYYLSDIDMSSGEELVIDTAGASEVEIVVGQDVSLVGTEIRIEGSGIVRFYVADDIALDGANVSVPDERSRQHWMYGTGNTDVDISDGSRFVGVLYVTGDDGNNDFTIKQSDVFGGVVAGEMDIQNGGTVHYDQALRIEQVVPVDADIPRITYLHVSITEIEVDD